MKKFLMTLLTGTLFSTACYAGGFNGSGVYNRYYNWTNDKNNGINITASRFDTEDSGFATGLSTTITKDGQQTTTARVPFAVGLDVNIGSATTPGFSFIGDTGSGFYESATGNINVTIEGTGVGGFDSTGLDAMVVGGTTPAAGSFTTLAASSTATIGSTLNVVGNFSVATNKFNVTAASGNTAIAGTLAVTGSTTVPTPSAGDNSTKVATTAFIAGIPAVTVQIFTSGSAQTYTTATNAKWLDIIMVGAGGGGGGLGGTTAPTGGTGGDTIFNSIHAAGGVGGTGATTAPGGAGGAGGTGGTGTATNRIPGQAGADGSSVSSGVMQFGSDGGSSPCFGGGARGSIYSAGTGRAGIANTGGGGAGVSAAITQDPSGGGGSGECVELIVTSPSATYTYTVGASGAGGIGTGTNATTAGAGAAGKIIVYEHYI